MATTITRRHYVDWDSLFMLESPVSVLAYLERDLEKKVRREGGAHTENVRVQLIVEVTGEAP